MAREAKAKAASCWLDRIMVTGAVMRHRTWGQSMCGVTDLLAQTRDRVYFPQKSLWGQVPGELSIQKGPKVGM